MKHIQTATTIITSAYLTGHPMPAGDVPGIINVIAKTLAGLLVNGSDGPTRLTHVGGVSRAPAVPVERSLFPNRIVCLECGTDNMMLKRHISNAHGFTPDEYRARWGLPSSYPMVTPDYGKERSRLAKEMGLGKSPRTGKTPRRMARG